MQSPAAPSSQTPAFTPSELASWTGGAWEGTPATVRGISNNGRELSRGALYVAIRGERFDGHDFIGQAVAGGAAAAMVQQDWQGKTSLPLLRVADTRVALADAAAGYRRTWRGCVAGVTGSVGKTTTKEFIACLFRAAGTAAATAGNLNNDLGLPLSLLAAPRDVQRGVFEIGSNHPGEIAALARILRPDYAALTAVGPVHIEHFGSIEAIADEKADLLRAVPADGFVVLDADGARFDYLRRQARARVVTVSLEREDADYSGSVIDEWEGGVDVRSRAAGRSQRLISGLAGRHQAANLLLAVAVACEAGVPWERLQDGLRGMRQMPMRWQKISADGVQVINDAYNANLPGMLAALRTFAALPGATRRVVALGDMLELGAFEEPLHREVGRAVASGPWQALVCVGKRAGWIADEAIAAGYPAGQVWRYADAAAASASAAEWAQPGDTVLLKASRGIGLERVAEALAK
jgi:UDP-N-acetylmuramoyl-tripeptide--D-alanyl-D-alanine ligase